MELRIKSPRDMTFRDLASIIWRRVKPGKEPAVSIITRWHPNPWAGSFLTWKRGFDEYEKAKRIREAKRERF